MRHIPLQFSYAIQGEIFYKYISFNLAISALSSNQFKIRIKQKLLLNILETVN